MSTPEPADPALAALLAALPGSAVVDDPVALGRALGTALERARGAWPGLAGAIAPAGFAAFLAPRLVRETGRGEPAAPPSGGPTDLPGRLLALHLEDLY